MAMDPAGLSYGSDQHGLVWAYAFQAGQPGKPLDSAEVPRWIAGRNARPPGSFLWLHASLSNAAAGQWLRGHLDLPEAFHESLYQAPGSTRIELQDEVLVAFINDILFDFRFDAADVSTVSICVQPDLLVSARLRPLRSLDRLHSAVRNGQAFRSPTELLAHLMQDQAQGLVDIVRQSTGRVDGIEDRLLANRRTTNRTELGALRRMLVRLQRLLSPEPATLFRLLNRPPAWIGEDDLSDLRQAAEEFSAAVADSVALVERVRLLQEELSAQISEQTDRTLFVLTVVTVLAVPINLMAGLFGMNVGGIPLQGNPRGFLWISGTLLAITAVLAYLALVRRRE